MAGKHRVGEFIKFNPKHDPSIDHRGEIVEVMTDEKGTPTGSYIVEDRDWGRIEVHDNDILQTIT